MLDFLKSTHHSPSPLVQSCAKSAKAIWRGNDQEWPSKFWINGHGVQVSVLLWLIVFKNKKNLKAFFEDPDNLLWKNGLSLRGEHKICLLAKFGPLWCISLSKNLTNKKQKNLRHILKFFWNQDWHGFWCRSYELEIFDKLMFYTVIM